MSDDYFRMVFVDDGSGKNLLDKKGRDPKQKQSEEVVVPAQTVLKLRIEKKGRGGKTVTVIDELPNNQKYFKSLLKELKRYCGSGGTLKLPTLEMQGNLLEKVRSFLVKRGFQVKG